MPETFEYFDDDSLRKLAQDVHKKLMLLELQKGKFTSAHLPVHIAVQADEEREYYQAIIQELKRRESIQSSS